MEAKQIKVPGKLYIAGEYSILTPGHSAIVAAVDRYITFEAGLASREHATIYSEKFMKHPIHWGRRASGQIFLRSKYRFKYVVQAMEVAETYVKEARNTQSLPYYFIRTQTDLKTKSGHKLGLGSSAAITIGTIQIILQLFGIDHDPDLLFKLGAITHLSLGASGSFGDLAASAYGGLIQYTNFNRDAIINKLPNATINELLNSDWNSLDIQQLPIPSNWKLLVGWTGSPSSTHKQIKKAPAKDLALESYQIQMNNIQELVTIASSALYSNDFETFSASLNHNQELMKELEKYTGRIIETPMLKAFREINISHHLPSKISGAGGGDCGISWTTNEEIIPILYEEWKQAGITPLKIQIASEGGNYEAR